MLDFNDGQTDGSEGICPQALNRLDCRSYAADWYEALTGELVLSSWIVME